MFGVALLLHAPQMTVPPLIGEGRLLVKRTGLGDPGECKFSLDAGHSLLPLVFPLGIYMLIGGWSGIIVLRGG